MSGLILHTERLTLRPLTLEDAAPAARLMTPGIARWTGSWRGDESAAEVLLRIERYLADEDIGVACHRVIERTGNSAPIGWIGGARMVDEPRRGAIGYWIGEPFFGQGYTKEAMAALVPALWQALDVDVIEGVAQVGNTASIAILRGLGMRHVGQRMVFASARGASDLCEAFEIDRP